MKAAAPRAKALDPYAEGSIEILTGLFEWRGFRKTDALSVPAGNPPAG